MNADASLLPHRPAVFLLTPATLSMVLITVTNFPRRPSALSCSSLNANLLLSKAYSSDGLDRLRHTLMMSSTSDRWAASFGSGDQMASEAGRDTKQLQKETPRDSNDDESPSTSQLLTRFTPPSSPRCLLLPSPPPPPPCSPLRPFSSSSFVLLPPPLL